VFTEKSSCFLYFVPTGIGGFLFIPMKKAYHFGIDKSTFLGEHNYTCVPLTGMIIRRFSCCRNGFSDVFGHGCGQPVHEIAQQAPIRECFDFAPRKLHNYLKKS